MYGEHLPKRDVTDIGGHMTTQPAQSADTSLLIFTVSDEYKGLRLDKYLGLVAPESSRSFFHALIDQERVTINGKSALKPSIVVKAGDTITVLLPINLKHEYAPVDLPLGIELIHEHEQFLILNKPAGLNVHAPNSHSTEPTVVDWLIARYGEIKQVGSPDRPGIVHRLDKDTSGLLLVPRTNFAHRYFGDAFKNRTIKKVYHALVVGHPPREGIIDAGIVRDPIARTKMTTTTRLHARHLSTSQVGTIRESVTNYYVKEYYANHSFLEVHPHTGRTHQIRVHLASIGFPIIGDSVYGTKSLYIARQALHAFSLTFTFKEKNYFFSYEAPADFRECFEKLQKESL